MSDFELLRDARHEVAQLAAAHRASIAAFKAPGHAWFKLDVDEELEDRAVRHKSTTASCLESLDDIPEDPRSVELRNDVASAFADAALQEPGDEWESEDAAYVYCRVRTLPALIRFAPKVVDTRAAKVKELVDYVWDEVGDEPRSQGVYEQPEFDKSKAEENKQRPSYPPNAFHTFWALRVLQMCSDRPSLEDIASPHQKQRSIATLWTQNMLGAQIALQRAGSDRADPNQLAWALIAQFVDPRKPVEPVVSEFARGDLYRAALDALFAQQLENGTWPLGQPLFHYPRAGNAYCYTFETLTELLRPALLEAEGAMLRDLLRPHLERLMNAFHYAKRTSRTLTSDGVAQGWSSGHHPHRTFAEGWATAAVFSYTQCFRRLLAKWTRDQASSDLRRRPVRRAAALTREDALEELAERGDTWRSESEWSVGEQLAALFLHPIAAASPAADGPLDPDLRLIAEDQARSAILFGPPGTSKTTVVEALAASMGWEFVEIRASDFLSGGMDRVPAQADEIFDRLMELDHCVILFDEIDELLRERQEAETDPFGRFLTTSMLPKVAELWKQRRVIFFVATNDLAHADRAIKRSQRFDATIFVPPPALAVKLKQLRKKLKPGKPPRANLGEVESALAKSADENPLGYLALVRYDQLDELAARLRGKPATRAELEGALRTMGEHLRSTDWHYWPRPGDANDGDNDPFDGFRQQRNDQHYDYRMMRLICVRCEGGEPDPPAEPAFVVKRDGNSYFRLPPTIERPPEAVPTSIGNATADGLLRYTC